MCGIAGFLDLAAATQREEGTGLSAQMARQLIHRGPDDSGVWADACSGIFLAHRRLSILDLSPAGHQPMVSPSGRFAVAFNGEIYNHRELRSQMDSEGSGAIWRGHSDTEVMLTVIERHGLRRALDRMVGMFAIALWDHVEHELLLVRDRVGEKPLYWGRFGDFIVFGSQLKALRSHPAFVGEVDRDALVALLRYGYVPAPHSIYRRVQKVEPGTLVRFPSPARGPVVERYWSAREVVAAGKAKPWRGDDAETTVELERLVSQSVKMQLEADVPVGAFLSGGIDSSLVVALAQNASNRPVRTFSIGFEANGFNEAHHAKAVARHLGTDHAELYVSSAEAMAVVRSLPEIFDEPLSDPSQIPTFLVSQLARKHVTVSLSGDGGDELFAGYTRYLMGDKLRRTVDVMPQFSRPIVAASLAALSPAAWNLVLKPILAILPKRFRYANMGDKLHKIAAAINASPTDIYLNLVSHWTVPGRVVQDGKEPMTSLLSPGNATDFASFIERGALLDLVSYLPDDILAKVDRAAMAVSLESRIPLLDHRIIEFAWRLPLNMKSRGSEGKWLLRQVLYRHVPKSLTDRPKMGFGIPLGSWLRGPLRDWAEALLDVTRIRQEGFFDPEPIQEKWREHLSGDRNWQDLLWDVLVFQAWLERQKDLPGISP